MNPASDTPTPESGARPAIGGDADHRIPSNWREALCGLISSRAALFELESKEFAKTGARRGIYLAATLACVFFTWALLLAGGIAAVSHATGLAWHWIALIAAALHLVAALLFMRAAKSPATPAFPVTRAEFQKDREWIENLQKTPKSNG